MKLFGLLTAAAAAIIFVGCSSTPDQAQINNSLDRAYACLVEGNVESAVDICNELTASADSSALSWHDYCRAATVYAAAYDHDIETEASMALATKCISRALRMQPDSVERYLSTLSGEYAVALNTALRTLDGLNTDRSTIGDHEEGDFVDTDETVGDDHAAHNHENELQHG